MVSGEMITHILRFAPVAVFATTHSSGFVEVVLHLPIHHSKSNIQHRLQPATIYALPATASSPLILRLKNLMLKTCPIHPQNRLQPVFVKQEEFVFCDQKQSHQ